MLSSCRLGGKRYDSGARLASGAVDVDPFEPRPGMPRPSWRERLRGLAIDISPLRESRQLRLLYLGNLVTSVGNEVTFVAIAFQVFQLTHSTLAVGLLGLCYLLPLLTLSWSEAPSATPWIADRSCS